MRALGIFVAGVTVLAIAVACGSSDGGTTPEADDDAGTVTADYCTKYCAAQASAGTLQGSRTECLDDCCKDVSGGCPLADAAADDTPEDAGPTGDGSTCLNPCNGTCCPSGQGCVEDTTGKKSCVATCFTSADCPATGCCAPAQNKAGDAVGPYVCKPNDGKDYHCCSGISTTCVSVDTCCIQDKQGNEFCAKTCATAAACGAAHCLASDAVLLSNCLDGNACQP